MNNNSKMIFTKDEMKIYLMCLGGASAPTITDQLSKTEVVTDANTVLGVLEERLKQAIEFEDSVEFESVSYTFTNNIVLSKIEGKEQSWYNTALAVIFFETLYTVNDDSFKDILLDSHSRLIKGYYRAFKHLRISELVLLVRSVILNSPIIDNIFDVLVESNIVEPALDSGKNYMRVVGFFRFIVEVFYSSLNSMGVDAFETTTYEVETSIGKGVVNTDDKTITFNTDKLIKEIDTGGKDVGNSISITINDPILLIEGVDIERYVKVIPLVD